MGISSCLGEVKKKTNKIINFEVSEEAKEEKYDSPDIINSKNLIKNDNHLDNKVIIIKAKKMNEFENTISEKNIEKSIKSQYILKGIFSFLSEKQKLKIIIYNKNLQIKLDINIENYKRIRGIYKKGERNGKGKEYHYGQFIFEGEYLNGKRNGKGKEYYDNGELLFEGEYLNGKRNGKGKEYYDNGKLLFEGGYLNGERNGKGKEYYDNGKLKFEGQYLNGKRNGKGKEYYYNGKLIFEGEYLNGERWNGKGKKYYDNGKLEFEGEYLNGKIWNVKGYNKEGKIDFKIKEGKGKGKEYDL